MAAFEPLTYKINEDLTLNLSDFYQPYSILKSKKIVTGRQFKIYLGFICPKTLTPLEHPFWHA